MHLYFKIGLNTLYQVAARALTAIVGLIATRIITSNLGIEGFGDYQIVITYVTLYWILTDFGLNAIAVREMAVNEERQSTFFSALITLRGFLGIVLLLLSLLILFFMPYEMVVKQAIVLASSTIFFQSIMGSANGLFQVRLRYDQQLISNLLGSAVSLSLVLLSSEREWGLVGFISAFISNSLVMATVNFLLARRWVKVRVSKDIKKLKYLFKETLPFGTALLFSLATFKVDSLLLSTLSLNGIENNSAVGMYSLAYKVFELILIIPVFFMNPVYPVLVRHLETSFQKFRSSVVNAESVLLLGSIAVIAVVYPFAPKIISLLAEGEGFMDSVNLLRILVLWSPLFFTTALLMWNLVTLKKQKELIIIYAIGFLFNLSTNLYFLPMYHYWAAAYITGATEALILLLLLYFVGKSWIERKSLQTTIAS